MPVVTCPVCSAPFSRTSSMRRHWNRLHGPYRVVYPCWFCNHTSSNLADYQQHYERHLNELSSSSSSSSSDQQFVDQRQALDGAFSIHRMPFRPALPVNSVSEAARPAARRLLQNLVLQHGVMRAAVVLIVRFERLDADGNLIDMDEGVFRGPSEYVRLADSQEEFDAFWRGQFERIFQLLADFKTRGSDWIITHATGLTIEAARARGLTGGNDSEMIKTLKKYLKKVIFGATRPRRLLTSWRAAIVLFAQWNTHSVKKVATLYSRPKLIRTTLQLSRLTRWNESTII